MLPENINWNAVLQSITDTWLPLIGMVAAIILVAIIVHSACFFEAAVRKKAHNR